MALRHCPNGMDPILVGDLNIYLSQTEGTEHGKYIVEMIVLESLKDIDQLIQATVGAEEPLVMDNGAGGIRRCCSI